MALQSKVIKRREWDDAEEIVKQFYKPNNGKFTTNELQALFNSVKKQYDKLSAEKKPKFKFIALGPDRWHTFKRYDADDFSLYDDADYYEGKVANPKKFSEFSQVQMYILKDL